MWQAFYLVNAIHLHRDYINYILPHLQKMETKLTGLKNLHKLEQSEVMGFILFHLFTETGELETAVDTGRAKRAQGMQQWGAGVENVSVREQVNLSSLYSREPPKVCGHGIGIEVSLGEKYLWNSFTWWGGGKGLQKSSCNMLIIKDMFQNFGLPKKFSFNSSFPCALWSTLVLNEGYMKHQNLGLKKWTNQANFHQQGEQ